MKVCFDIVTTSGTGVTSTKPIVQTSTLDIIYANYMTVSGSIIVPVQTLTVQTAPGLQLQLTKKNDDLVIVRFLGSVANIKKGQTMSRTLVDKPFRPAVVQSLIGHLVGRNSIFHIDINPDGSITWWGASIGNTPIATRGNGSYFIK